MPPAQQLDLAERENPILDDSESHDPRAERTRDAILAAVSFLLSEK